MYPFIHVSEIGHAGGGRGLRENRTKCRTIECTVLHQNV